MYQPNSPIISDETLHYFKTGDPNHKQPKFVHDSLELLALRGSKEFPNVRTDSPVSGHYSYDIRTLCQYNRGEDRIVLAQDKIPLARQILSHLNERNVPDVPSEKDLISIATNGYAQISRAIIENSAIIKSHLNGIQRLQIYMHAKLIDQIKAALELKTDRDSYIPTFLADNNCISHILLEKIFKNGNNKQFQTPAGSIAYSKNQAATLYEELKKKYDLVVVRLPHASTGQGLKICRSQEEFTQILENEIFSPYFSDTNPAGFKVNRLIELLENSNEVPAEMLEKYLENPLGLKIEGFIAPENSNQNISLGATLWIDKDEHNPQHHLIGLSQQGLSNHVIHESNLYTPEIWSAEIEEFLKVCADFLYQLKAYGTNGIDFLVSKNLAGQIEKIVFMEINPRETGQSHLNRLTHKLTGTAFPKNRAYKGLNIKDQRPLGQLIHDLENQEIIYNHDNRKGTLVLNLIEEAHKGMIYIIAENKEEVDEIEQRLKKI